MATPLLMPYLALELPPRHHLHSGITLGADILRPTQHPHVTARMFARANRPVSNVFGEIFGVREDQGFRYLRQRRGWVEPFDLDVTQIQVSLAGHVQFNYGIGQRCEPKSVL